MNSNAIFIDDRYVVSMLEKLVSVYSVTGSEGEIGSVLLSELERLGVDCVNAQRVTDDTYNVIASISGVLPGPRVLFTGHMDTVAAGNGWETDPFLPSIAGDKLYGRGSLDMKGGIAAVLGLVKYAVSHRDEMHGEIKIAFVTDEEAYSKGVDRLIEEGIVADLGISAEPENNPMIIGAVGKTLIEVTAEGVSAHGSQSENGINAVEDMAKFIAALGTMSIPLHPRIPSQPYVTLKIEGGFKEYAIVVPDNCVALINKHTVPDETEEFILEQMGRLVQELKLKSRFQFAIRPPSYPAYDVGDSMSEFDKLSKIYFDVTGEILELGYCSGVSDNNRLVPMTGIPVVCLGAKGGGLHGANEWVSISSVIQISEIYRRFVFNN